MPSDFSNDDTLVAELPDFSSGNLAVPDFSEGNTPDSTTGEKIVNALGAIPRGAVDVAASIPESIAIAARELDRRVINLSGIPDDAPLSDRGLFQLGQWMRKETAEAFPKDPRLEDSFWAEQVPSGIGSTIGFLGTGGLLSGARNVAGKVMARKITETAAEKALQDAVLTTTGKGLEFVAKAAPIMASGAMVNAVQGYKDAIDKKADEDTAIASFVANGVGGIAEAAPIQRILNRINRSTGGGISKAIRDILTSGAEELIQESGQQALGNVIAQNLYDSEREALEGVAAAGGAGGVTGALLSALGIGGKRLLRGAQAPQADQFQDPVTGEWLSAEDYTARQQRAPETRIVTPFIPAVTPTRAAPQWALEELKSRGFDPDSMVFPLVDVQQKHIRDAIMVDPTLTLDQKANLIATGSVKTPLAGTEAASEVVKAREWMKQSELKSTPTQEEQDAIALRIEQENSERERARIAAQSAIRVRGKIFTGQAHALALVKAERELGSINQSEIELGWLMDGAWHDIDRNPEGSPGYKPYSQAERMGQLPPSEPVTPPSVAPITLTTVKLPEGVTLETLTVDQLRNIEDRLKSKLDAALTAEESGFPVIGGSASIVADIETVQGVLKSKPSVTPVVPPAIISRGRFRPAPTQQTVRPAFVQPIYTDDAVNKAMDLLAELRAVMAASPGPKSLAIVKEKLKELPEGLKPYVLADIEHYERSIKPPTVAQPATVETSALKIGDEQTIMQVPSVLADTKTIGGVRWDLFNGASLKEDRAAVRVIDDSGEVLQLKQFPTYDAAERYYKSETGKAQKMEAPAKPPVEAKAKEPWEMTKDEWESPPHVDEFKRLAAEEAKKAGVVSGHDWQSNAGRLVNEKATERFFANHPELNREQWKNRKSKTAHKALVRDAINRGDIASHPDYPDLSPKAPPAPKPITPKQQIAIDAKVLTAANVETTADVRGAQEQKPLGTQSEFSPKVAKQQKKFLLDAVDQAIAEAPTERPRVESDADMEALDSVRQFAPQESREAFESREREVTDRLAEKYGVSKTYQAHEGAMSIEPGAHVIESFPAGEHGINALKGLVREAITRAIFQQSQKVVIEVPGDGTFEVVNSQKSLSDFKERAAKFPTTAAKIKQPSQARTSATAAAPLGKPDREGALAALGPSTAAASEEGRKILWNIWSDGKQSVAVNGRMLTLVKVGLGGTVAKPILVTIEGKPANLERGAKFPDWTQVVPTNLTESMKNLDTEKLFTVLRQAQETTSDRANSVKLWRNPDGSLGVTSNDVETGSYEHNVQGEASTVIMAIDPKYLINAINAARRVGDKTISLEWLDELSPIKVSSKHTFSIIMPMRLSTGIERGTNEQEAPQDQNRPVQAEGISPVVAESETGGQGVVETDLQQSGEVLWGSSNELEQVILNAGGTDRKADGRVQGAKQDLGRGVHSGTTEGSGGVFQTTRVLVERTPENEIPSTWRQINLLAHRILFGTNKSKATLGGLDFVTALFKKLPGLKIYIHDFGARSGYANYYQSIKGDFDFVEINVRELGRFDLSKPADMAFWNAAVIEELLHGATLRTSTKSELEAVWRSLTGRERATVQEIYTTPQTESNYGAEYIRIILQERLTGDVSEKHADRNLKGPARTVLQNLVRFLKRIFGIKPADNIARQVIERIEGAIKGDAPIAGSIFDERQSFATDISRPTIDEDLGQLADELGTIRSQDEEGVYTKVGNVHDQVLSRPGLNNAVREDSVTNAQDALQEAGLVVARHDDGLFELVDTVTPQEEGGQNLVTILEREIQSARTENRPERIANLLNTVVVHLARDKNKAFSQATKNRLYALAQGERSAFGRALGGLAMWGKVLANVAMNPSIHLNRIYSDNFGGDDISEVMERLKKILGAKPTAQEVEDALNKVQAEFSKKSRIFDKGGKLWGKIQKAVRDRLFDPGPILEDLARTNGMTVPTEEQKAWLREQVEKEERLRTPTQRDIDSAGGDMEKATELAAKGTESERLKIIKDIQAHWSRWSQPVAWNPFKWTAQTRRNWAKAINELVSANFLFTPGFPIRQWMDVMLTSLPLNAVNRTLVHAVERGSAQDLYAASEEMIVARIASLKATLRAMERAAGGNLDRKVLERMTHSIGVFERMRVKADELEAKGNQAGALAIRLASILQAGYRVASVFDASQATGLEWQEMRQQLSTDLRAQGKTRAEISTQLNDILGGIHVDMAEAISEVTAIKQERGLPINKKTIEQDAWALIKARAYDRMRQATGTATDYQAENEQLRELHSWNLPETGGIGGAIAGTIDFIKRYTEKAGIPTAGLFSFGNAMGIAANRMATFSGGGLFGGFGFGDSPWYQGERNIRQRRIEAIEGLAVVGLLVALAAAGKILIMTRYPDDKDEKERFIAEGHKLNTIRFIQDDGRWLEYPIAMSPFSFIASPLYMIGGIQRLLINQQKAQERLNAEAAKTGAAPGQAPAIGPGDVLGVVAQGMYGMLTGGRTASGAIQSFSDYGDFNLNRASSSLVRGYIPGVPAWQAVARMMGVAIDSRTATLFEQLVPVPGSQHQRVNSLGDPMTNPNDAVRVLQVLTGGVGFGSDSAKGDYAYQQLAVAGYAAPAIGRGKGYNFGGTVRPLTPKEYERYTVERGKAFKQELESLGSLDGLDSGDARKAAQGAFQRANQRALASVGVSEMKPKRAYTRRLRSVGGITRRGRSSGGRIRRGRTPSFGKLRTARAPRLKRAVLSGTRKQRVQRIVPANF